jgi:hypothetical protein
MATPKKWVKITLFLSSYFPLWIIFLATLVYSYHDNLFLVNADAKDPTSEYFVRNGAVLSAAGFLLFIAFFPLGILKGLITETLSGTNSDTIKILSKEEMTSEYMLYVVTYVFPFLTSNLFDPSTGIPLTGLMVTLSLIYIRANLFHVNPTLMLLGYRLFKVSDGPNTYYLLSRRDFVYNNLTIKAHSLSGIIYIEKPFTAKDSAPVVSQ